MNKKISEKNKFKLKLFGKKIGKYFLFFVVPTVIENFFGVFPEYSGVAMGVILTGLSNFLKHGRN